MAHLSRMFRAWHEEAALCRRPPPRSPSYRHVTGKVISIMCVQFSTCSRALGNSGTEWGRFSSKTSKKDFMVCSFQEHLYTSQTTAAFLPQAAVAALGVPDAQAGTIRLPPNTTPCFYCPNVPKL